MIDWILIIVSSLRVIVMITIALLLLKKWNKAERKFFTDIPFLMFCFFILWGVAKIIDVYIYSAFTLADGDNPSDMLLNLGKTRAFFLALETIPMWILAVLIWFPKKTRFQYIISIFIVVLNLSLALSIRVYADLLRVVPLIIVPGSILHIVTYFILFKEKRLPIINSQYLFIGFLWMLINSVFMVTFRTTGTGPWGNVWMHELIELIIVVILGYGLLTPAKYSIFFEEKSPLQNNPVKT